MYQLYIIPGSCSTGIHVLLNKLNQPVEIIKRDDVKNYRELVRTNQVPALKTDTNLLTEGAAIALHLLTEHGQKELVNDQEFMRWMIFNYATLHPAYSKLFTVNGMMENGEAKHELLQKLGDRVVELWQIIDRHLQGRETMHGNSVSIIDYLLAVYVRWGNMFPDISMPVGENVLKLVNRVSALPEFKQALEREDVAYAIPKNAFAN